MSTEEREAAAVKAIDGWAGEGERLEQDWRIIAIVHGLIAIAEAIDRHNQGKIP